MTMTVAEADDLALLRTFVGAETIAEWEAAGADAPGVQEAAGGATPWTDATWAAIDRLAEQGRVASDELVDQVIAEAEAKDLAGVPFERGDGADEKVRAVMAQEGAAGGDAADGEFAALAESIGIVDSADDVLALHGITTKTTGA